MGRIFTSTYYIHDPLLAVKRRYFFSEDFQVILKCFSNSQAKSDGLVITARG